MTEIKEGPELDKAVAEAIGWTCDRITAVTRLHDGTSLIQVTTRNAETGIECIPKFSTDLNAAFEAAWKAGMFLQLSHINQDTWMVEAMSLGDYYATATTPALAIGDAILRLNG